MCDSILELIDRADCGIQGGFPPARHFCITMAKRNITKAAAGKLRQERHAKAKLAYAEYLRVLETGAKPKVKTIADAFGAPRTNLRNMINGVDSKEESAAKRQILYEQEEHAMVQYLIETAKRGFPDTPRRAVQCANQILRERTGDVNASVGKNWIHRFLQRHKTQLSLFWSTTLTTVRGGALNEANVNHWYNLLQEIINEYKIDAGLIFTMDETSCFLDKCTHKTRHIGATGQRQQIAIRNENRETCTLIPIICADGEVYGPTVIFKGKQIRGKDTLPNPLNAS